MLFWLDVKFARFSSSSGKLTESHIFAPLSSPILSYINIFDINRKLVQAFTWKENILCLIIDKGTREH